jgi:hypothetical protein
MPCFTGWTIRDMGLQDCPVSGVNILIPPVDRCIAARKAKNILKLSVRQGTEVVIADPNVENCLMDKKTDIKLSTGIFYSPIALIDAVKAVSALMGLDFKRCTVCIADASTPMGVIMTELLIYEVSYLILCSRDKDKLMDRVDSYMINTGLSPAVVGNVKKAVAASDILIYTGGMDYEELESHISHKVLVANTTNSVVQRSKDILIVDDAVMQADKEPVIDDNNCNLPLLTSRIWEGALLTLVDFDTGKFAVEKCKKVGDIARRYGVTLKSVVSCGRQLYREGIYKYR